ncbi:histidine kinase [Porticoccaceae bacterium]|nr:histidine kinase [Porticoccaceae bacterium]
MRNLKRDFSSSLASTISVALVSIIALGLVTIFSLMWATDQTDQDAQAINLSGSIRMQTYRIGLATVQQDKLIAKEYMQQLDDTWQHPLFSQQRQEPPADLLGEHFFNAEQHWRTVLRPQIEVALGTQKGGPELAQAIDNQLALTEKVVSAFQQAAESKIRLLRIIQLTALFLTVILGAVIFNLLKTRLEKPLAQLTDAADRIGKGDYGYQTRIEGSDELALLGSVVNQMSNSVEQIYRDMDDQVKQRTAELNNNNIALEFLFETARKILTSYQQEINYQQLLDQLAEVIGGEMQLEICLFTEQGDRPYRRIAAANCEISDCSQRDCNSCIGDNPIDTQDALQCSLDIAEGSRYTAEGSQNNAEGSRYTAKGSQNNAEGSQDTAEGSQNTAECSFPIIREETGYGIIKCHSTKPFNLELWQEKLLRSMADQFALALSLSVHRNQQRRLAMLTERTVIARELHDSLAQALSYLKIQVTRLQKSIDSQAFDQQQPIVDELREGLTSAYRQLRELLTTFRLKIDTGGLQSALEQVVNQLNERNSMQVALHYQLTNLPLNPTEEIHLLQIIREASQNAINHSLGTQLDIHLFQNANQSIQLLIDDNGIGIPEKAEKNNHYGLAIIQERSRHLNGNVEIARRPEGGTRVAFAFQPSFLS